MLKFSLSKRLKTVVLKRTVILKGCQVVKKVSWIRNSKMKETNGGKRSVNN